MMRLAPTYWLAGSDTVTRVHGDGLSVAKLLFRRLADTARREQVHVALVVLYNMPLAEEDSAFSSSIRDVVPPELPVLDMYPFLKAESETEPQIYQEFYFGPGRHMTPEGNAFMAEQVLNFLQSRGILAGGPAH